MATSLAIIVLLGLLMSAIFEKIRLPGLLGMLILGVLIGPHVFNVIDKELLDVSQDFRLIALIVILLRAGLGLSRKKLNQFGITAVKLGFIPGLFEGFAIAIVATFLLDFTFIQGGILGFIVAAVSPAVVVPLMLKFNETGIGNDRGIPTLVLAGASLDDVVAITIFSTFLGLYSGSAVNIGVKIISIPIAILLGIALGIIFGFILVWLFKKFHIRDTKKVLIILGIAILLTSIEDAIKTSIDVAALLGVMTVGFILLEYRPKVAHRLANKFNKVWVFAEILLFVLVGAQVDIYVALDAGMVGFVIIFIGLLFRSIGVWLSTYRSSLTVKERLFCVVSYTPKATVQAAISAIPLQMGVASGDVILAIGVLSILITAPIGAIAIKKTAPILLDES